MSRPKCNHLNEVAGELNPGEHERSLQKLMMDILQIGHFIAWHFGIRSTFFQIAKTNSKVALSLAKAIWKFILDSIYACNNVALLSTRNYENI